MLVHLDVVVDAAPGAPGVAGHADVVTAAVGNLVAGRTATGLVDKTRLGGDHLAVAVFVLDAAQEPVGNLDSIGVLRGFAGGVDVLGEDFAAQVVLHGCLQDHGHADHGRVVLLIMHTHRVGEMRRRGEAQVRHFFVHQNGELLLRVFHQAGV